MASPTPNKGYTYPAHGGSVNAWDTPLNTNFDYIDLNVGGTYPLTIGSTTSSITYNSSYAAVGSAATSITPPSSLAQNIYYKYTGTMTNDQDVVFPAAGGIYVINNASDGDFALTATVSGSTSVSANIPQGGTNVIITDGADMVLANSNILAKLTTYLGDPNGNVAGTAGATSGAATDARWDATNRNLYAAVVSGTASTTVWGPVCGKLIPQGYLTVSTDNDNPIITSNTTATSIKYVPYMGNWTLLSDGTAIYPYQFSAMTLTLTAAQASNIIYDVFMWWNSGSPVIGTGPAWSVSTAGSGARGTGAGTTQLSRLAGIWTNTVQVTLTNSATTYTCPAGEGIYLGSLWIDSTAGQVTCHRSYGQSRKWGVFNAYNRVPVYLKAGDSTSSWTYSSTTIRAANGNSANSAGAFCGLPEEIITAETQQGIGQDNNNRGSSTGVGWNSTSAFSGLLQVLSNFSGTTNKQTTGGRFVSPPSVGLNTITSLERADVGTVTFFGTSSYMQLTVTYRA